MKKYSGALFLVWSGVIIVAYYVVQKPGLLGAFSGLVDTAWTLLVASILLFNSYAIGKWIFHEIKFDNGPGVERLLLGTGLGLGALGLLGLCFSVVQLAYEPLLTGVQLLLAGYFLLRRDVKHLQADLHDLTSRFHFSFSQYSALSRAAIGLTVLFSFLLTLVPPFEAFDALLYHLTLPAEVLQRGGLYPVDNPPFWFPGLTENVYLWALGMGSERAAQVLHFAWAVISGLLLWHWAEKGWGKEIGRKALLLVAAIPSLVMLASWAYADMALVYYALAALYGFSHSRAAHSSAWLVIAAGMSGLAMGIKYTSFVLPLTCGLLLLFQTPVRRALGSAAWFSLVALAVASPWYIRNAVYMDNPVYPFVWGGRFWDAFLTHWYADAGTGIGWNPLQILLLPLNTVLGTRDATFFDGRTGLLFLLLAPFTIWVFVSQARRDSLAGWSLISIGVFVLLSFTAWTMGVVSSAALWQARLLLPALVPLTIPSALAWESLKAFDTSRLRISTLANALIGMILVLTLIDNAIFVLQRNPLAVALGAQSRERYIERINPSYAALISLMDTLPAEAHVYSLFEPRSYGLPRSTQPDPITYNFAHDVYLYRTPAAILQNWKSEQYTHILVYERGLDFLTENASYKFTPAMQSILQETLDQLTLAGQTPDGVYSLYAVP